MAFGVTINPFYGRLDMVGTSSTTPTIIQSLTTVQRIAYSAATGEIVFDTDVGAIFRWSGSAWAQVSA